MARLGRELVRRELLVQFRVQLGFMLSGERANIVWRVSVGTMIAF
jgi:hypothetical protein